MTRYAEDDDCLRVWVGGLPRDTTEQDIEKEFDRFGRIKEIRLKTNQTPPFAFIEFEAEEDAKDCIKEMDQGKFLGVTVKVQFEKPARSKGKGKDYYGGGKDYRDDYRGRSRDSRGRGRGGRYSPPRYDRYDDRRGGYGYHDKGYGKGKKGNGKSTTEKGNYKITIKHIPSDMSWHELKELGKEYIEDDKDSVTFSRTFRNREGIQCGILEFKSREHANLVTEKLDGRKFRGQETRLLVIEGEERR